MEWRCEWCGKPHESDDPPCDNCGHGEFERAVVREAGDAGPDSTMVWVCPECGREHTKHSPPCSRCNNPTLERREKRVDESNLTEAPGTADADAAVGADSTTVWVCTECGREHAKHSPPCSRCGNADLERREKRVADDELSAPGYLELLTPGYMVALAAVLALATVFVLGVTGVADVPGLGGGVPEVRGVPGNATSANGVSLGAVEDAYVAGQNERLDGGTALTRDSDLDAAATFLNQRLVKAEYGDGAEPSGSEVADQVRGVCGDSEPSSVVLSLEPDPAGSAGELGAAFVDRYAASSPPAIERGLTGVDVHAAPDGRLVLTQISC